ncbi:hypothetical protein [Chondromyces crocatus]|uniref:Uncharacterized protein n=1 Tax=Chondromyces crocatus TaxID=52 RepID=A0A0K1ESX4_CHOCO|nr:hypothetical protein [Chondromyces crocatus]AKT43899.1 uncharacterized protein CMC5_081360 [Chondromyces crocatus]
MRKVGALVALVLLGGCSAAASQVEAPSPQSAPAPRAWQGASLGSAGIRVSMPGEPMVAHQRWVAGHGGEIDLDGLLLMDGDETTADYAVWRLKLTGEWPAVIVDPDTLLGMALSDIEVTATQDHLSHQGFPGRGVEGRVQGASGLIEHVFARAFAVGGDAYLLTVDAAPGRIERHTAERFFDSFQLTLPWRVQAFEEGGFTVAVPDAAVLLPHGEEEDEDRWIRGNTLILGGEEGVVFTLVHGKLPSSGWAKPGAEAPRELLELLGREFRSKTPMGIEQVVPTQVAGIPGWEILGRYRYEGDHFCIRVRVQGDRMIALGVASQRPDVQSDVRATRFFESLQVRRAP